MITLDRDFLRSNDFGLLVLRLSMGGLMLFHGIHKLVGGVSGIAGMLQGSGLPSFIAYGAYIGEVVTPIMMIIGLWTRGAAFVFAFNMIVAILMAHLGVLCSVDPNTGGWAVELPALYLLGATALCFTGGGKYALTKGTFLD